MKTMDEIKKAIEALSAKEARQIADWLKKNCDEKWDKQINEDISSGRIEKLWQRASIDISAGRVKPLSEVINERKR